MADFCDKDTQLKYFELQFGLAEETGTILISSRVSFLRFVEVESCYIVYLCLWQGVAARLW